MDEQPVDALKPPYLPFQTFLGFISELGSKPLPPQIDRSMMSSKSGTDQANLFAALKFFGLIDDSQVVQEPLKTLAAADETGRKGAISSLLRQRYPGQFDVSERNGTEKLLLDSLEKDFGYTGDTRRKAMTFFLHAARWTGMELSAHFPVTRMGSGRAAAGRPKRTARKKAATGTATTSTKTVGAGGDGERVHVSLGPAGTVVVEVNVRWLELPDETFTDLRRIIKELRALGIEDAGEGTGAEEIEDEPEEVSTP